MLGLVRGGVPWPPGSRTALPAPLDVLVVRKLGVPWAPEVAFGAIGPGGDADASIPDVPQRISAAEMAGVVCHASSTNSRRRDAAAIGATGSP